MVDGRGGERRIENAEAEHRGISEPEGQPRHETDFRDLDGSQAPGRIDAVADRAAGEYARAHVVPDRIAGEGGERGRPIRHVVAADRAQRKQVIEGQREISTGDEHAGEHDVAQVRGDQRFDHFGGIDRAQDTIERHRRNRDDGDAERDADPVPPDPSVAEHRRPMQRIEHSALTILWSRLHRSTRHAISRQPLAPPISSLQRPMSNPTPRRPPRGRFEPMAGND